VSGEEGAKALLAEAAGVRRAGVALEEGEADWRVDLAEDTGGAGPEGVQLRAQLVGEADALLDQVLARPGQRSQRPRFVAVGLEQAQAVHVGAGELGQDVGVEAVRLAAAGAVAVAGGGELVGVDRNDAGARLEQPVDDEPVRLLDRDPGDVELEQSPHERSHAFLAVRVAPLLQPAPVPADDDQPMLLACEVDPGRALHPASSFGRCAGSGPTGEVPWRMLIGRPSGGRRPVAAPGASHRREALVSCGPSERQANMALSRRWSATTRSYEPRRSTPSLTACGRTLSFQRTSKTKGKVGL